MPKINTESFIEKAKSRHTIEYDYSKVIYKSTHTPIIIICPKHGEITMTPLYHLSGYGCSKCTGWGARPVEEFLRLANEKYNNKYNYDTTDYIDSSSTIKVICPIHGETSMQAKWHIGGCKTGCEKCGKEEKYNKLRINVIKNFIEKGNKIHNNHYTYNNIDYSSWKEHVIVTCPVHGDFLQRPGHHLKGHGCSKCSSIIAGTNRILKQEEIIKRIQNVHGSLYDLSKVNYTGSKNKVILGCKEHGDFEIIPDDIFHQNGGCQKCVFRKSFTRTSFAEMCNGRKSYVYLIKLTNEYESFYKIGITVRLHYRFIDFKHFYKVELIDTIESYDGIFIYDKEVELHRRYKHLKYKPQSVFGGYTECFELSDEILNTFKQ